MTLIPFRVDCAVETPKAAARSLLLARGAEENFPAFTLEISARLGRVRVFERTCPVLRPAGFPSPGDGQYYQR
jgi:hypothetical protein